MARKNLTREEQSRRKRRHWQQHHKAWQKSGLSQSEYCRRNSLSIKNFTYWRRKFKQIEASGQLIQVPPILLNTSLSTQPIQVALKLEVGNRYKVEIGEDFSTNTLTRLINTSEQC